MNDIEFKVGLKGFYRLVAHSPERGSRVLAEFENLILDAGLNRMAEGSRLDFCQVGSGSAAPLSTDTALGSIVGASSAAGPNNNQIAYVAGPPDYIETLFVRRFNPGVATGTLAEVGMGWASSGSLFSRALILDAESNPTTVTVLADETLDVEYRIRIYPPAADVSGVINISGVDYNYVIRPSFVSTVASNQVGGWYGIDLAGVTALHLAATAMIYPAGSVLGSRTSGPSGSATAATPSVSNAAYSTGSFERAGTLTFGLTTGNLAGGIQTMRYGWICGSSASSAVCSWQCSFDPPIPKDNTKVLALTFKVTWINL